MTEFIISDLQDASILALNDMRDAIKIDPEYQREGGVWSVQKRQLFIDSLLNRYDVPKLYFHQLSGSHKSSKHLYAVVDGRQRLEAVWGFLDGKFALAKDFEYGEDPEISVAGMTYIEIVKKYPRIATRLNARSLTVMVISAEEIDFIEDMFTRLNEAVPLNAAEKRNSFGGPLPKATRELVKRAFFTERVPISSTRYRHHDLVARILYVQWSWEAWSEIADTKKASLDEFYRSFASKTYAEIEPLLCQVEATLTIMERTFINRDDLLKSSGMIAVYYLLFAVAREALCDGKITRSALVQFEGIRAENRRKFETEQEGVDFRLIEYDELGRSSNDAAAIGARLSILRRQLGV